ncbi:integrase, partial [[Kitasatospora] papulosa]
RRLGRPHETIPDDPHGDLGLARFRRTLAWHIARRPGGLVALAIQYGHLRTAVSAGYASRSRDGIHDLLDIETARATADTLAALHTDLQAGASISGPAARRAIRAAGQAPAFAGAIRTRRQARDILDNPQLAVYDNPHAFVMCVYDRDRALCHRLDTTDSPSLDRCRPSCTNIARTDDHATQITRRAAALEDQADTEAVPGPLTDRLRHHAARLKSAAAEHERTRITLRQETGS